MGADFESVGGGVGVEEGAGDGEVEEMGVRFFQEVAGAVIFVLEGCGDFWGDGWFVDGAEGFGEVVGFAFESGGLGSGVPVLDEVIESGSFEEREVAGYD